MTKATLWLSFLAACLSGYAAWSSHEAARDARAQGEANAALERRIGDLEASGAARHAAAPPPLAEPPAGSGSASGPPGASLAGHRASETSAGDLDRRVAELEKRDKEYTEALSKWKAAGGEGAREVAQAATGPVTASMPSIYNTVEDAEKSLALTPQQKAEFERTVEDAKRDIDELKKIRDDEGKTWADAERDVVKMDGTSISFDMSKVQAFREKVIPGRNESFGAAERRISDGAKKRLRDSLTAEQQGKFDKALMPGLVGSGAGFGDLFSVVGVESVTTTDAPVMGDK